MTLDQIWNLDIFQPAVRDALKNAMDSYCASLDGCKKPAPLPISEFRWLNLWKKFDQNANDYSSALKCVDGVPAAGFRFLTLSKNGKTYDNVEMDVAC